MSEFPNYSTIAIHGDSEFHDSQDVAPPIRLSSTYRYNSNPDDLVAPGAAGAIEGSELWYSRISNPSAYKAEKILSEIIGKPSILYANGLAAFHAAVTAVNPKTVFIGTPSYHGCHGILQLLKRNYGIKVYDLDDDPSLLQKGDLIHVESPANPISTCRDIAKYAKIAHERGAYLMVDATFAPPPLSDPFKFGADIVMHSGTKYFGGHSDLLAGVLATESADLRKTLYADRLVLGSICSSFDAWLLVRSLRTLNIRVKTQVANAERIVKYLTEHKNELPLLKEVSHASLQKEQFVREQLPLGGPPVLQITAVSKDAARRIPSKLKYFFHATSLGGVESLIEWRCLSDPHAPPDTLRVSVGAENVEDLIEDLRKALQQ